METCVGAGVAVIVAAGALWQVSRAREEARTKFCASILASYGRAFSAYAVDHGGLLPYENVGHERAGRVAWYHALEPYLGSAGRVCPSVDTSSSNPEEGYRMNSQLCREGPPPAPYRLIRSLDRPSATVLLFDAEYGGKKLSLKGQLKDAEFRHNGTSNVLFVDGRVDRYARKRLIEESGWLPPKVVWNPDSGTAPASQPAEKSPKGR